MIKTKIIILLPYKENFSTNTAGAVSIFVNDTNKLSKYKKNIKVFGYTSYDESFKNYTNLYIEKKILFSTTNKYFILVPSSIG